MKEKIKNLNLYQKAILLIMFAMILGFTILYHMTISRLGFEYNDAILAPTEQDGNKIYSGKLKGKQAVFTVTDDQTVTFQHGDKTYGPYMIKEDPTILVKDIDFNAEDMIRIEVTCGDEILFRGGILRNSNTTWLYDEDGGLEHMFLTYGTSNGVVMDSNGNEIDPMEPTIHDIVNLVYYPALTHNGTWSAWLCSVFLCVITVVEIFFADEFFRFRISFRVQDADLVEPSDWEIMGRYICWTILPVVALIMFIVGLQ